MLNVSALLCCYSWFQVTENFAYLPFGGGRRKCVGDQFALFEALVALAMLIRRYDFVPAPDAPPVAMTTGEKREGREGRGGGRGGEAFIGDRG